MDDWNALARALRTLHAALLRRARAQWVWDQGKTDDEVGPGELLMLATRDESFAWLRSLSELMTEIDELRDSPEATQDTSLRAAVRTTIEDLLAAPAEGESPTPFQERYWRHVRAEPEVTMAHAAVRQALAAWPRGGTGRSLMETHLQNVRKGPPS